MLKVALNLEKSEPAHPRRVVGAQMTECATAESEAWCHLTCMTCVTHPEVRVIMGGSREHPRPAVRKLASSSESPQTGTWACYLLFSEPDLQAHPLGSQVSVIESWEFVKNYESAISACQEGAFCLSTIGKPIIVPATWYMLNKCYLNK